jgi:hypothetical protein
MMQMRIKGKHDINQGVNSMANQEHLDILKQGVDVWNRWREEHSEVRPDFSGANLSYANLSYANLSHAHYSCTYYPINYRVLRDPKKLHHLHPHVTC